MNQWQLNWLWLTYYWQTSITLNKTISYYWFLKLNVKKSSRVNKPKLYLDAISKQTQYSLNFTQKQQPKKLSKTIHLNMFISFITLNLNPYIKYEQPHTQFTLFFMNSNSSGSFTLNLKKCYMRWHATHALLYNLFYYDNNIITFGHKIFKTDILTLNTIICPTSTAWFKYVDKFPGFKDTLYGSNVTNLFETVKTFQIETAVLTDMTTNIKTATNLQICDIYTLGIISYSDNPWVVSYPIPVYANGLFTQYYFIKYLYNIHQTANNARFKQYVQLWNNL